MLIYVKKQEALYIGFWRLERSIVLVFIEQVKYMFSEGFNLK